MDALPEVIRQFNELSRVSRCSGNEEPVRTWLQAWARSRNLDTARDGAGNIRIDIPATSGRAGEASLVLQAHQDMVCEARSGSAYDFAQSGISVERDGDWLTAWETTLGADDGAGIALMLGLYDAGLPDHPQLEFLFTASEESTMAGARGLEAGFLRGRLLLNLDSEQEGSLTIGCAGLRGIEVKLPVERHTRSAATGHGAAVCAKISVTGLRGGHSAVDIHRGQANANLILARFLRFARGRLELQLTSLKSGNALNMVAREGECTVLLPGQLLPQLVELSAAASNRLREEFADTDPSLEISCSEISGSTRAALTTASLNRVCDLIVALPHGVIRVFDPPSSGLVRTSVNLARAELSERELVIELSMRAATREDGDEAAKQVEAVASLAGARFGSTTWFEPWRAKDQSISRIRAVSAYRKALRSAIREEIAHGVLECGVIAERIPDMDMVSIGPTIAGAHSPGERVSVSSLERVARFLHEYIRAPKDAERSK